MGEGVITALIGGGMPWWAVLIAIILTAYLTYLGISKKSTDKSQTELLKQTVIRQHQLDERQQKMLDDFEEENNRQRDDIRLLREEVMTERRRNEVLGAEVHDLRWHNEELQRENAMLKEQIRLLKEELGLLTKNRRGSDHDANVEQQ